MKSSTLQKRSLFSVTGDDRRRGLYPGNNHFS